MLCCNDNSNQQELTQPLSTHRKSDFCDTTSDKFFPVLPGALQSTNPAVQATQEVLSFNHLYCVQKSHIHVNVTSHNQTWTSLCEGNFNKPFWWKHRVPSLFPKAWPSRPRKQSQRKVQPLTAESRNEFLVEQRHAQRLPAHLEVGVGCSNTAVCSAGEWSQWPSCESLHDLRARIKSHQLEQRNSSIQMFVR